MVQMVWFRCSVQSQDNKKDKINWIDKVLVLILIIQKRIESSMQKVQLGGCTLCCYWSLISNEAVCWCWSCTVGNYQPIIAPYIITTHRSLAPDWSSPATRTNPALPLVGGNETKARPPPAAGHAASHSQAAAAPHLCGWKMVIMTQLHLSSAASDLDNWSLFLSTDS